ncbi:MAG TPA: inositol monophosphatase family protein [Bellilinea sp.]|nr:inositol monophosphatase family protein [Bellilinea sp.]
MSIGELEKNLKIKEAVIRAGKFALSKRLEAVARIKTDGTPTTDIELSIEKSILDNLADLYPGQPLLTEEQGKFGNSADSLWILDPIDGTRVYLSGLPIWGVSLGRFSNDHPDLGFFYLPRLDDIYWGGPEIGFWKNETKIEQFTYRDPEDPLAFILVSSNAHRYFKFTLPRVRAFGSLAAHMSYIADGTALGAVMHRAKIWDIAGVLPLLAAAGISVEYLDGDPVNYMDLMDGRDIPKPVIAGHESVLPYLRENIKQL